MDNTVVANFVRNRIKNLSWIKNMFPTLNIWVKEIKDADSNEVKEYRIIISDGKRDLHHIISVLELDTIRYPEILENQIVEKCKFLASHL